MFCNLMFPRSFYDDAYHDSYGVYDDFVNKNNKVCCN